MMRLTLALALVAGAAAIDSCPSNSVQSNFPYVDMRSCTCNTGFQAYPYPGWGCYAVTEKYACPVHAELRPGVTVATQMSDCKCEEGWAPYQDKSGAWTCVYAYVFHVHGRLWLQPFSAENFGYAEEVDFQKAMASVLDIPQGNVLPYSVQDVPDIKADLANARLGYAKLLLAENEAGELDNDAGASIGFAVRVRGDSMADGHALVGEMKDSSRVSEMLAQWKQLVEEPAFTAVTYTNMFVWALTAEFWRPPATKELGDVCEFDYECKKTYTYPSQPQVNKCSFDRSTNDKRCRPPFNWAPQHPTEPPTPAPPTPAPTPLPAGVHYRARVEFTIDINTQCTGVPEDHKSLATCLSQNGLMAYTDFHAGRRAALLDGTAQALSVPAEHMYISSAVPIGIEKENFRPQFNPTHMIKKGLRVTLGYRIAGGANAFAELEALTNKIKATDTFATDIATYVSHVGWSLIAEGIVVDGESVHRETITTEHDTVTPAPTPVQIPGSSDYCGSGPLVTVDGTAVFYSKTEMNIHDANLWLDNTTNGPRVALTGDDAALFPAPTGCTSWTRITSFTPEKLPWYAVEGGNIFVYKITLGFNLDSSSQNPVAFENWFSGVITTDDSGDATAAYIEGVNNKCAGSSTQLPAFTVGNQDFFPTGVDAPMCASLTFGTVTQTNLASAPTPAPTQHVDCEVTSWTDWTQCSVSCGAGGTRTQFRMVITDGFGDGTRCRQTCGANGLTEDGQHSCEPLHASEPCNQGTVCPTDCVMGDWGGFGDCSETCGVGTMTRTREVEVTPSSDGVQCPTVRGEVFTTDVRECTLKKFCPVDCTLSEWGDFGSCSKRCDDGTGPGTRTRRRFIENTEYYGGTPCQESDMVEEQNCNENMCPVDCVVSGWSAWGSCSKTCAGKAPGTRLFGARQERTRYIVTPDKFGGRKCPVLTQTKLCALHPCGAHVCTTNHGFPLTCTFERGIVYTHHVNDVHDGELFMCYHNFVTEVCTCLCWPRNVISTATHSGASDVSSVSSLPSV